MSVMIRCEIEVSVPGASRERLEAVHEALQKALFCLEADIHERTGAMTLYGEESDYARGHKARGALVKETVLALEPTAKITSKWLDLDCLTWDMTFEHP